ncbi:hypothetical protein LWI29_027488 [Acer saccharum]|uniref:Potassium channel SKOR n=1 Tax=Acer saccharum TaxID=4024 RepID=A0AA39S560_ACESA|nr:hypothetical protein LWI29_027488 [Acer saccharum]
MESVIVELLTAEVSDGGIVDEGRGQRRNKCEEEEEEADLSFCESWNRKLDRRRLTVMGDIGREDADDHREFELESLRDQLKSSRASRFNLISNQFGGENRHNFSRQSVIDGIKGLTTSFINPEERWYRAWTKFILIWALYSSCFTPLEFGFFRGLPENLFILDIVGQVAFLLDILFNFFLAYRDNRTYRLVYKRSPIALRYLKSSFIIDLLSCMPWDIIYKACGRKEEVREGYTWIGSLKLGDYSYSSFREIDIWKRYTTSMYFAIVTMATVGYGDIHAVNLREMIFIMIYVSFDMILGAYLIGNMTALIVKGSKTEKFRDKMRDVIKYMNRNGLGRDIRNQIKGHLRLQYESSYTEAVALQDIPISIRAKISQTLYMPYIEKVPLFKGCSSEFINQIVIRLHEEFFLPGEVILEQGNVVDQLYFVCHGLLEEVGIGEDGSEDAVSKLLRIDKQSFTNILEIYFHDGRRILTNLLEGKESIRVKQLESDVNFHIGKHEAELALRVNSAAYHGDLYQLKGLIRAGADPNKTDYDGRSPLHLAASRGYEDIAHFLIQGGVDINIKDKFGNTPLLEALKNGHDRVASLLVKEGVSLDIDEAGSFLCTAVIRGDSDFLKRVLSNGIDPNKKDYDHRTPLHVASSEGLYLMAKLLLDAGASVFSKDRWGNTPLDEARICGNKNLIKLLEDAKSAQMPEFSYRSQSMIDKMHTRKCTVFPFHPWDSKEQRKHGVVLWVPHNIEELIRSATEQLDLPAESCVLSEGGGKILDVDMINDGQKLYLINQ